VDSNVVSRDKGNGKKTMPELRIPVLLPSQALDYSRPATLIENSNCFPQNMSLYRGDIAKRFGNSLYSTSGAISGAPVMGLGKMELNTGERYVVRASTLSLQKYNEITNAWDTITVTPFSGTANNYFDFANDPDDNLLIIVNGVDLIRKWDGKQNNQMLGGDPGIAATAVYFPPYVLLGNVIENGQALPFKVKWCDTAQPEKWLGGNAGAAVLSNEPSQLYKLKRLNEYIAAYKRNSIWLGLPNATDVWDWTCVKTGMGLMGMNCVAEIEAVHYFMGDNDFFMWDGATLTPIGGNVRDEVFSTIDKSQSYKFFAVPVRQQTEVWFYVVPLGQTFPTQIWKYNYRWKVWYFDTCVNITAGINYEGNLSAEKIITGDSSGNTYFVDKTTTNDNGIAVACSVATKDFTADKFEIRKRWLQLDFWAYGAGTIWVDYSIDRGATWVSIDSANLDPAMPTTPITMFFDVVSSHIRFRFRNSGSEEFFYLRKFYPYYLMEAESWR